MKYMVCAWSAFVLAGCSFNGKYQDDNIYEEFAEEIILEQTGVNIDLTPFSSETKSEK